MHVLAHLNLQWKNMMFEDCLVKVVLNDGR